MGRRTLRRGVGAGRSASLAVVAASLAVAVTPIGVPAGAPRDTAAADTAAADTVTVEILTSAPADAARAVRSVGGDVTGTVPGALVQAEIPEDSVALVLDRTAASDPTVSVRPVVQAQRPTPARTHLGATSADVETIVGASAWHDAGITGRVRVGVVDFFDLGVWDTARHGPVPGPDRRFCLDTIGSGYCPIPTDGSRAGDGHEHGVAVVEVLRSIAPDAEVYLATVASVADLRAAIDWFAANDVRIVTRSLGSAWDGPGDGTGALDAVVDHATSLGITWINSVGNEGAGRYARFVAEITPSGSVDFDPGPGVDETLLVTGGCIGFDGIRWAGDWWLPADQRSDYRIELDQKYAPITVIDLPQAAGAPPLEAADHYSCPVFGRYEIRIRRMSTGGDPTPDVIEIALFQGQIEDGRWSAAYSAAKAPADSHSPALLAVGAVDPAGGSTIAPYSSQGPTNDGRITPHLVAPSCLTNSMYSPARYGPGACFDGTSASSPVVAGVAALLADRGLAAPGVHLASLVRHLTADAGPPGPDTAFGAGIVRLPPPPPTVDERPSAYEPLTVPTRVLDTRAGSAVPGAPVGPFAPWTIVDVPVPVPAGAPVTAVAVNVAVVGAVTESYVQLLPTLAGTVGGHANLNVADTARVTPNAAVVPLGADGSISVYLPTGGDVVVDLMGVFRAVDTTGTGVSSGRFRPVDPLRLLDTRTGERPPAGTTVTVPGIPAGASAVAVNVTATDAAGPGFVRAQPAGSVGLATANGNYVAGSDAGTLSIVPVGSDGAIEIVTSNAAHLVVDLVGWFTDTSSAPGLDGLFVPAAPQRAYDSRHPGGAGHGSFEDRMVRLAHVPTGAAAVSANLAVVDADGPGWVTVRGAGRPRPPVSNVNHPAGGPISNATMTAVGSDAGVVIFGNRAAHVIIDVNGYFTGPA